jgi:hypothetical protein
MIKYTTLGEIVKKVNPELFFAIAVLTHATDNVDVSKKAVMSEKSRLTSLEFFKFAEEECRRLEIPMSLDMAKRIVYILSQTEAYCHDIDELGHELTNLILAEMKQRMLFSIELGKQKYLKSGRPLWGDVSTKFPSAESDIDNAGECLAYEQWTASVFHSMKILEIGLTVLANELGVPSNHTNWQNIINGISAKIKTINSTTFGADWKIKEQFYSEVALQFLYFKNAWRNYVMHGRTPYNEQQAEAIFNSVKEFMMRLATQLQEKGVI